jgi:hypothetical protein
VRPPSPRQLSDAYAVLLQAKERLEAIDPALLEDERLFADFLESEGSGALDVVDRLIRTAIEAEDFAAQAHVRATEIAEREARYKRRNKALRDTAFALMQALELRKIERPDFSASIALGGQPSVVVTEPEEIPEQFQRVVRTPDKAAIRLAIGNGETVPGAMLANPALSLRIRTT